VRLDLSSLLVQKSARIICFQSRTWFSYNLWTEERPLERNSHSLFLLPDFSELVVCFEEIEITFVKRVLRQLLDPHRWQCIFYRFILLAPSKFRLNFFWFFKCQINYPVSYWIDLGHYWLHSLLLWSMTEEIWCLHIRILFRDLVKDIFACSILIGYVSYSDFSRRRDLDHFNKLIFLLDTILLELKLRGYDW
jgi:hypothetical protein